MPERSWTGLQLPFLFFAKEKKVQGAQRKETGKCPKERKSGHCLLCSG